jgi:hypothetical protein
MTRKYQIAMYPAKFLLLLLFLSSYISVYPQNANVRKASRANNHVVYKKKVVKLFAGQRASLSFSKSKRKLNKLELTDSTTSLVTDFQNINATIQELNTHKQICIDYNYLENERRQPMTVLLVHNPTRTVLFYKAKIYSTEKHKYVKTKVLPVMPGLTGVETLTFYSPSVILYRLKVKMFEFE